MNANKPIEIPDDFYDDDVSFLAELEAAEAEAISLTSAKRRRVTLPSSSSDAVQEGPYTAALKGSRSLTWHQTKSFPSPASSTAQSTPRAVSSGGACFKCGMEGHWARDCSVSASSSVSTAASGAESEKLCRCGKGSCLVLTANTERNPGRKFYKCPVREENGGCGFFQWCDEPPREHISRQETAFKNGPQLEIYQYPTSKGTTGVTRSWDEYDRGTNASNSGYGTVQKFETSDNRSLGMRTSSSCFKCGEQGHWARDCPTPSPNTTAGARGKSSTNTCFKCGESGHWAKDCSEGQSSKFK